MPAKGWRAPIGPRFWASVQKTDNCWLWLGYTNAKGYGRFDRGGRSMVYAHRMSWELTFGPVPEDMCVLHKCDTPACVKLQHLFLGDRDVNNADMRAKGRHAFGERQGQAKLTDSQVLEIRQRFSIGERQVDLMHRFGVSATTMHNVVHGKTWRHAAN